MANEQNQDQEKIVEEQFDNKVNDTTLLALIKDWETEADEFQSNLKRIWEENLLYYKGIQTDVQKIRGKNSKAVENRIFMAIETMIPLVTARLPDAIVKPGQEDEQSVIDALDLQDILEYHFERVHIQELAERWIRDMVVKRYGVFKIYWDRDRDDVALKVIDPRRIKIPQYGKTVDELAFVIEELEMSYRQIEDFFGDAVAKKVKSQKQESDTKVRKKTYCIQEIWTNEFVVWKAGNEILKKEENLFYKDGGFFSYPKKPYVIKSLFETEDCIVGDTDYIQQVKYIQDNINTRKRQLEDITAKVSNPYLLIDSDVMSEEQASGITNEPGSILYGKDAASGTKIRFESPGQVSNAIFQDLQLSRQEFDNIWGIHSTTRGERQGKETLGGRQILREADLGRVDLIGRTLERALDEIAEYWTQLISLFYTEEKTFTILGQDGVRFVKNFTADRVGKVKPMVKSGSTLKEDEFSIKQSGIMLWQSKAIGLKTLYKMLKLPNMQGAIDDYIETQSGAILQGAQAPQVVQQGPEEQPGTLL